MTCRELIQKCEAQQKDLLARAEKAQAALSNKQWNEAPAVGWSPAQIFEHMTLASSPYIEILERELPIAPMGDESPVRHTLFGRMIYKVSGPSTNAPSPKNLHPSNKKHTREIYSVWMDQQNRIVKLHEMAKGKNLAAVKVSNPFVKLFKMTLCDFFAILATHTERHVGQIESRAKNAT